MSNQIANINRTCAEQLTVNDSCCRRQFLIELESALKELWEVNNFSQIESGEVGQISRHLFEIIGTIQFTSEKIWFCGKTVDGSDHQAENSLPYLSACLILLASNSVAENKIDVHFGALVTLVKQLFKNQSQLINALMDNDERLFFVLVSLIRLSKSRELPGLLDPLTLTLILLCEVDFSETVLVDWLCSETIAIVFSLQFFKLLHTKLDQIPNIFVAINQLMDFTKVKPIEFNSSEQVVATFEISELHGDELVKKTYPICVKTCTQQPSTTVTKTFTSSDLVGFVSRLRAKLGALNAKQLMPFNVAPLLRVITVVDDLM